jgi:ATP-dependent DNA helicase UvrD/PcrA
MRRIGGASMPASPGRAMILAKCASSPRQPGAAIDLPSGAAANPWTERRRPVLIEAGAVPRRGAEIRRVGGFKIGDRVFHQKFGYRASTAVEDNKLAIHFEHAGDKKIMDAYVERAS